MNRDYGKIAKLPERLANWVERCKRDKSLPWVGSGMVADMEAVVRLLSLEEFGKWLYAHSDEELQRWGVEVLDAAADRDALTGLMAELDKQVPPTDCNEPALNQIERAGEVRKVLVELGALSADDTETSIPDLLRALLA